METGQYEKNVQTPPTMCDFMTYFPLGLQWPLLTLTMINREYRKAMRRNNAENFVLIKKSGCMVVIAEYGDHEKGWAFYLSLVVPAT